jgi:hypothetical protein
VRGHTGRQRDAHRDAAGDDGHQFRQFRLEDGVDAAGRRDVIGVARARLRHRVEELLVVIAAHAEGARDDAVRRRALGERGERAGVGDTDVRKTVREEQDAMDRAGYLLHRPGDGPHAGMPAAFEVRRAARSHGRQRHAQCR